MRLNTQLISITQKSTTKSESLTKTCLNFPLWAVAKVEEEQWWADVQVREEFGEHLAVPPIFTKRTVFPGPLC